MSDVTDLLENAVEAGAAPHMVDQVHALLLATVASTYEQRRTADAMERIADRLDSWTYDPDDPEHKRRLREAARQGKAVGGPELRVRRW